MNTDLNLTSGLPASRRRRGARSSWRWAFPSALGVTLLVLLILWLGHEGDPQQSNRYVILAAGVLAVLLGYGVLARLLSPAQLTLARTAGYSDPATGNLSTLVPYGAPVNDTLTIANTRRWGLAPVAIEARIVGGTLPGHTKAVAGLLGAGKQVTLHAVTPCWQRGWFDLGQVTSARSDLLGIMEQAQASAQEQQIGVLPRLVAPPRWALPFRGRLDALQTTNGAREDVVFTVQPGNTVLGLRPMRPGEPPSHQAWAASLRKGAALARRWDTPDAEESLLVVLDLDVAGAADETLITLAISLANSALQRTTVPVGFVASGEAPKAFPAATGATYRSDLLVAAIDLQATPRSRANPAHQSTLSTPLCDALTQLTPGATLVVVTARPAAVWNDALADAQRRVNLTSVCVLAVETRPQTWELPAEQVLRLPARLGDLRNEQALLAALAGQTDARASEAQRTSPAAAQRA